MISVRVKNQTNSEIIKNLVEGNSLFHRDDHGLDEKITSTERRRLAHTQNPKIALITCADSRIVSHAIFQQGIGDLFELKVAGNVVNRSIAASLEFAVANLGTTLLIVMGHGNCGAIKGALDHPDIHEKSTDHPHCLKDLIADIQKGISCYKEDIEVVTKKNVLNSIDNLLEMSPLIRGKFYEGEVDIIGAYYNLKTGLVEFFER